MARGRKTREPLIPVRTNKPVRPQDTGPPPPPVRSTPLPPKHPAKSPTPSRRGG